MNRVIISIITAVACAACTFAGDGATNTTAGTTADQTVKIDTDKVFRHFLSAPLVEKFAMSYMADFNRSDAAKERNIRIVSYKWHDDGTATFRFVPRTHTCNSKRGDPVTPKDHVTPREITVRFTASIVTKVK